MNCPGPPVSIIGGPLYCAMRKSNLPCFSLRRTRDAYRLAWLHMHP